MNRKLNQLLQPSFRLYFLFLILFAILSAAFSLPLAGLELAIVVGLGVYARESGRRRRKELNKYLDNYTGTVDTATKDTMVNSPLPMVLFRPESDDIIWTNDRFLQLTGQKEHLYDTKLSALLPALTPGGSSRARTNAPRMWSSTAGGFWSLATWCAPGPHRRLPGHHLLGGRHRAANIRDRYEASRRWPPSCSSTTTRT